MQWQGAIFASFYRRFLIVAFLGVALFLVGSVSASAQEQRASELPGPGPSEGCDTPKEIATFSGTDNRRTDVFAVSSDVLRVRYLTEVTDPDSIDDNLVVTVFQANGDFVDSVLILDPASGSQNVLLPGPGNYYLEIEAGDVRYELAIDACGGDLPPQPGGSGNAAGDQYDDGGGNADGGDVNNPKDVIPDTTSKKPLPNTGGVPLLGLAFGALAFAGAGFSVLRFSIRRDA